MPIGLRRAWTPRPRPDELAEWELVDVADEPARAGHFDGMLARLDACMALIGSGRAGGGGQMTRSLPPSTGIWAPVVTRSVAPTQARTALAMSSEVISAFSRLRAL